MPRFIGIIAAAILLTACASRLSTHAKETMDSYRAQQESSLSNIAALR